MGKKHKNVETVQINTNDQEATVDQTEATKTEFETLPTDTTEPVEAAAASETLPAEVPAVPIAEAEPVLAAVVPVEAKTEEKKARNTVTRADVASRRSQVADAIFQAISAAAKPLSRADISRAADDILGRPGDATSWVDGGVAIAALLKAGTIEEAKVEGKKKTLYRLVAAETEVQAPVEEPAAAEAAAE